MSSPILPSLPPEILSYSSSIPYMGGCEPVEEYPDRVFINEDDLSRFFEQWVQVRESKILREEGKRGFGFLTLSNETDAMILRNLTPEKLLFQGQRLNIGPARKRISICQKKIYPGEGFGVVTPEGYHSPGTYTFCLDKAPHFLPRSPSTKTQLPLTPEAAFMHTAGQSTSARSISPVTSEHEVQSISEDKQGFREANNNISNLLPTNIRMESFYQPVISYFPLPLQLFNHNFQMPLPQPRVYSVYKEPHEGGSFKPFYYTS